LSSTARASGLVVALAESPGSGAGAGGGSPLPHAMVRTLTTITLFVTCMAATLDEEAHDAQAFALV
jgi:hypothetical protein